VMGIVVLLTFISSFGPVPAATAAAGNPTR